MSKQSFQTLEIVAGPNGSGKSSFADVLFNKKNAKKRFINPDIIAAGLSRQGNGHDDFSAGRIMVTAVRDAIAKRESFGFESTLSGRSWKKTLEGAREAQYQITIYFLFLNKVSLNIERIKKRVKEGGHYVPREAVVRRHSRAFRNFWELYRPLGFSWFILDNSGRFPKKITSKSEFEKMSSEQQNDFVAFFLEKGGCL